ncbi:MAG TPA: CmcI family methyltransferase [Candidatus Micrarchaeaceae archaeon]|nr:CmcI family methyltransferase [Candidatus Micrarchaeaceae archaeon]
MITIDGNTVTLRDSGDLCRSFDIGTPEAFRILSGLWLRSGWDNKYVYSFTWLGRPVIQLPEDMIRLQEAIWSVEPDVIVETGVAHGGSLIFCASLCRVMGRGRVIGVEIDLRPHNRNAIESHALAPLITLVDGDSASAETVAKVRKKIRPRERVMVLLDSSHAKDHVRRELEAYAPLVAAGSYIVAMDGIMATLAGAPRSRPDWGVNNPRQAAREFAAAHGEFELVEPAFPFNEGSIRERVTYWPDAFLRRRAAGHGPPPEARQVARTAGKANPRSGTRRSRAR